jgi:hypothetical protein
MNIFQQQCQTELVGNAVLEQELEEWRHIHYEVSDTLFMQRTKPANSSKKKLKAFKQKSRTGTTCNIPRSNQSGTRKENPSLFMSKPKTRIGELGGSQMASAAAGTRAARHHTC